MWNTFSNNLPNVNIRDLEINTNDNTLTAGTYGRGIWQTAINRVAPNTDLNLVELQTNGGEITCGNNSISILVENAGMTTINTIDLYYSIDGGTSVLQQNTVSIAPQSTTSIDLTGLNLSLGAHTIRVNITTANDYFAANNQGIIEVLTNSSGVVNDVYQFETRAFLASNIGDASSAWQRGAANGGVLGSATVGATNVYATNLSGEYGNDSTSYLYSGCYDLTQAINPVLSFDMAFDIENNWDLLYMEYSTDGGNNWTILGTASDTNWYNSNRFPTSSDCFNCVGAQWTGTETTLTNYNLSLNSLNNPSEVIFRYILKTDGSITDEGAVIDNFVITGTLSTLSAPLEDSFSLYPNPSTGIFNISCNAGEKFDYNVYDVSGKRIAARKNNTGSLHVVDLSGVSQGMYFINISTATGTVTKKLMVK